jgi:hypothetical protein
MKRKLILVSALLILIAIVLIGILFNGANDPPIAESNIIKTQEDTPISITLTGSDSDGDSLDFHIVTEPSHGSLSGTEPKMFYSPGKDFHGSDSFAFKVSDGLQEFARLYQPRIGKMQIQLSRNG